MLYGVTDVIMANVSLKCMRVASVFIPRFRTSQSRKCAYSCNEFNGTVFTVIRGYSNVNGSMCLIKQRNRGAWN